MLIDTIPDTIPEVIEAVAAILKDETLADVDKHSNVLYLMGVLKAVNDQQEWEREVDHA